MYRVAKANVDLLKNMLLLKSSQFLPNYYEPKGPYTNYVDKQGGGGLPNVYATK